MKEGKPTKETWGGRVKATRGACGDTEIEGKWRSETNGEVLMKNKGHKIQRRETKLVIWGGRTKG